jgi:hypothetical protein
MAAQIRFDLRELNRSLREYAVVSTRSFAELVNQTGFNVTTAASKLTDKANKQAIKAKIQSEGWRIINSEGMRGWRQHHYGSEKGLRGEQMKEAIGRLAASRGGSVGYMRAGFLPSIAAFAKAIRKQVRASTEKSLAKWARAPLGSAVVARPSLRPLATFIHEAFGKRTQNPSANKIAEAGIQKAVDQEVTRIRGRIEGRLASDAQKFFNRVTR